MQILLTRRLARQIRPIVETLRRALVRMRQMKTTNGWERTPVHISRNEVAIADSRRDDWHLIRVWNFALKPQAFDLRRPLKAHVS
jgi:hypothetical protein